MRRTVTGFFCCSCAVLMFSLGCGNPSDDAALPVDANAISVPADQSDAVQTDESGATDDEDGSAEGEPAEQNDVTPAQSAMMSMFSPTRAPQRKTMGLLQRSFLDIAAEGDQELQIAIVVDGTESMEEELAGVRSSIHQMLSDLRRYRNNDVSAAIVVYRDAGSPSGPATILQKNFTSDEATIEKAVQSLTPESGAPYFHELPDVGLHTAIDQLNWSEDDQVTKWILMFGDAPPYSESRRDEEDTKGRRHFQTKLLVGIANAKGIRINCVLCTSRGDESASYNKAIDETRLFMNELSGGTGGLMLDLSNPETRNAIVSAAKKPEVQFTEIEPITAIGLASVRRDDIEVGGAPVKQVRIAVLPHMPLETIRASGIRPEDKAVQVSTALRTRLSKVAGVRVTSPVDIELQLRRLRSSSLSWRGLASRLRVDYVVWGEASPKGNMFHSAAYRRNDGEKIVTVNLPTNVDQGTWAHTFLTAASEQAGNDAMGQLISHVDSNESLKAGMTQSMADSASTSAELLVALESLEQALEYDTRSDKSEKLLKVARQASEAAGEAEKRNPLAHWLQANVAYNQSAHLFQVGNKPAASQRREDMKKALNAAFRWREQILMGSLKSEVIGDYALLVKGDLAAAVEQYESMTKRDQPLATQLRGHWMLAGIYAGDWGAAGSPVVDSAKARRHVMEVMSNWPDSPQATLLKRWLKYDETTQQTQYNYLPIVNVEFTGA